jgi:Domain of unknown function (DUF4397)
MRAVSFLMVGVVAAASCGATACGNGDDTSSPPPPMPAADAGVDASKGLDATAGPDAGDDGASLEAAPDAADVSVPIRALLRVANWSADAPPVDFCLAKHGTSVFDGPILAANAGSIDDAGVLDAGSGSLAFPQASAYLLLDPGQYDARIVAAGSVNCATGIADATSLPVLASGSLHTIALVGAVSPQHGEPKLAIVGFVDELKNSIQGALLIRVINAAADLPKAEVGTFDVYFTPFLSPVSFGASSVGDPMADPNGYISELPIVDQTIAARASVATLLGASAHTIVAQAPDMTLSLGASVTFVVIGANGQVTSDGGSASSELLECVDSAGTVGLEGSCQVVSQ